MEKDFTFNRLDLAARAVNAALWLDHSIRRDTIVYLVFKDGYFKVDGNVRQMRPDERSIALFLIRARRLGNYNGVVFSEGFPELEYGYILDVKAKKITNFDKNVFFLGDNKGIPSEVLKKLGPYVLGKVSLGNVGYTTSACIHVLHYLMDLNS